MLSRPQGFSFVQKAGNLLEVDLLLKPLSIKPIFYTLLFRKGQGVTPSNSPQLQMDVGTGKLSVGQFPLACRVQDLSEVNTESNAVDKTLQIAWACSRLLHW